MSAIALKYTHTIRCLNHPQHVQNRVQVGFHTFTCSFEVTAQKTISVNPWVGNIRKQIPPITRPSLIRARVLCFLSSKIRKRSNCVSQGLKLRSERGALFLFIRNICHQYEQYCINKGHVIFITALDHTTGHEYCISTYSVCGWRPLACDL